MTFGLACDRDGYDLRQPQCRECGSRGCPKRDHCKTTTPLFAPGWLQRQLRDVVAEGRAEQTRLKTSEPPNRLYGAQLNTEGDAI